MLIWMLNVIALINLIENFNFILFYILFINEKDVQVIHNALYVKKIFT